MDIEAVRKASMRGKTLTAQRTADNRLNERSYEMRDAARDFRIRVSAMRDLNSRHPMLRLAVDYERRANQFDKENAVVPDRETSPAD